MAIHPSDMAVALAVLDAVVHVEGPNGARSIPIAEFFALPADTPDIDNTLLPAELIVSIELPPSPYAENSGHSQDPDRHSYAFALVSVAAGISVTDGVVTAAALALGGCGRQTVAAYRRRAQSVGKRPGPSCASHGGPIGDVRRRAVEPERVQNRPRPPTGVVRALTLATTDHTYD